MLELTRSPDGVSSPVWLNPFKITAIYPWAGGATVRTDDGQTYHVAETCEQVVAGIVAYALEGP